MCKNLFQSITCTYYLAPWRTEITFHLENSDSLTVPLLLQSPDACISASCTTDCKARKVPSSPRSHATDLSTTAQDGKATSNSVPAGAKPGGRTGMTVSARLGQSVLQSAIGELTTSIQLGQRSRAQRAPGSSRAGILTQSWAETVPTFYVISQRTKAKSSL